MAETETETTALAPRELVTEIERTRANLAQTIDQIADRVAPGNIARRAGDRAKERCGFSRRQYLGPSSWGFPT